MNRNRLAAAPLLTCVLAASLAPAQPSTPPAATPPASPAPIITDAALAAELRQIDAHAATITDLTASFEQAKKSVLLKKPLVSKGTVRVKGSRVLWNTSSPHPTAMLLESTRLSIFYPEQRVLEVYDLDDALRRVATTPLPRLEAVNEQFEISRSPRQPADPARLLSIDLSPRGEELRARIRSVRVTIDRSTGLAAEIDMTDIDGEETVITFSDARVNQGVSDRDLDLGVPEGTRISKPLEGLRVPPPPDKPAEQPR